MASGMVCYVDELHGEPTSTVALVGLAVLGFVSAAGTVRSNLALARIRTALQQQKALTRTSSSRPPKETLGTRETGGAIQRK